VRMKVSDAATHGRSGGIDACRRSGLEGFMKRMMSAGAVFFGSTLVLAATACSTGDPSVSEGDSPSKPHAGGASSVPISKLAVVSVPATSNAAKRLKLSSSNRLRPPTRPVAGGRPGACGLTVGDANCDACVTNSCCAEGAACAADADCLDLVTCYGACADNACFAACDGAHPAGAATLGVFVNCLDTNCPAECGPPPPPPPPPPPACGGLGSGDPTCDACLDATCCGEATTCGSDADCIDLIRCFGGCQDAACEAACQAAHPTGLLEITALSTCLTNNCAAACAPPPPPPPPASCGLSTGVPSCDACLDTKCCGLAAACAADADCIALLTCAQACNDGVCIDACVAAHRAGAATLDAVSACLQNQCGPSCN